MNTIYSEYTVADLLSAIEEQTVIRNAASLCGNTGKLLAARLRIAELTRELETRGILTKELLAGDKEQES